MWKTGLRQAETVACGITKAETQAVVFTEKGHLLLKALLSRSHQLFEERFCVLSAKKPKTSLGTVPLFIPSCCA
jgi:hypothetical protein